MRIGGAVISLLMCSPGSGCRVSNVRVGEGVRVGGLEAE